MTAGVHVGNRAAIKANEPLWRHTTLHVGGPADWFLKIGAADGDEPLRDALRWAHAEGIAVTVIGGGSNVLAADAGVNGLVIKLLTPRPAIHVDTNDPAAPIVTGHAGMLMSGFAEACGERGLAGLEWAVGLPGTLGGAVANNAGAHGAEMSAAFLDATLIRYDGTPQTVTADDMAYAYRHSAIKDGTIPGVLTTISVRLTPGDPAELRARATEYHDWRKTAQPQAASAGSMFQNPPGDAAGRLIEACGLKGHTIGQAQVSPVHANFIVNLGKATAAEVLAVGDHCRACVEARFGIELHYEVQRIGRWDARETGKS
ncbi:MAG: UDP-N-acetylmuramate dehydrogenase [Chloroflexota bacterium]|nr:UDP-N-acetylmuramate dehydrogenase [Chloroflexota bacterium]